MSICARGITAATAWLLVGCGCAIAQVAPQTTTVPSSASTQESKDTRSLTELLAAMQAQMLTLSSQMADMRKQQQDATAETVDLRREIVLLKAQLDSNVSTAGIKPKTSGAVASSADPSATTSIGYGAPPDVRAQSAARADVSTQPADAVSAPSRPQSVEDRLESLEENQQITDGKLSDQYQTKVESGSKYHLRLTGTLLFDLYDNHGMVDSQDVPGFATPPDFFGANKAFGGSLRQSRIGLEASGPDIFGAHTSANIEFDFGGGFPQTPNGTIMGLVRLRTGTVRLDWKNTSIVAGQDYLFFAPLAPTSLAQFAVPALSYSGNLWAWTPQIRIEHRFQLDRAQKITVSGGILDSLTGDFPNPGIALPSSWGEQSGLPAVAARAAWSVPISDQFLTIGVGGYAGRQFWGFGRNINGWVVNGDITVPLGKRFALTGEIYRGNAVGGIGGGIGQSILVSGSFISASGTVVGLDSVGGWAQFKYKATPKLEFNAALGIDNPFTNELRQHSSTFSPYGALLAKNISPFANFIYAARSNVMFSVEYRYLRTSMLDSGHSSVNHLDLSIAYAF
jgi:hypothetical protein